MNHCLLFKKISKNIAVVTMNRPQAYNAYNQEMVRFFEKVITQTEQDRDILCVILTGANDTFSSGADLKEVHLDNGKKLLSHLNGYQPLQYTKRSKIWIAAIEGFALGGGFEMCLDCDFIVASREAKFGLPEINYNLFPVGGGIQNLVKNIPLQQLKKIVLTGSLLTAEDMDKLNLIYQICEKGEAVDIAIDLAKHLQQKNHSAIMCANNLINQIEFLETNQWDALVQEYIKKLRNIK